MDTLFPPLHGILHEASTDHIIVDSSKGRRAGYLKQAGEASFTRGVLIMTPTLLLFHIPFYYNLFYFMGYPLNQYMDRFFNPSQDLNSIIT